LIYFRYAAYYDNNGTLTRDLFKAYGVRFIIKVTGKAGKFNLVPLMQNIGSGIGLLALVGIHCFVHSRIHPVHIRLHLMRIILDHH
jgi:ATP P2X receptor